MKKAVQFRKDFGLDNDWKNLFCLEPKIKELLKKGNINYA